MSKFGSCDFSDLSKLKEQLESLQQNFDDFIIDLAKEIAKNLLNKVKKRTPVVSGTLRKNWKIDEIKKKGEDYIISISNPIEYASYVEYGHRTKNHKGWVNGKFMLTISINEIEKLTPDLLEKRLEKKLGDAFK